MQFNDYSERMYQGDNEFRNIEPMNATEITVIVFFILLSAVMIAEAFVLNGIHKIAKEMKDEVRKHEEKYGKK